MSSKTFSDLITHLDAVRQAEGTVQGFEFGYDYQLNSRNKTYPLLQVLPGRPDSAVEGSDFTQGRAFETHNLILRLVDEYGQEERQLVALADKYTALQGVLMRLLFTAFGPDYLPDYELKGNVRFNRRPVAGNIQGAEVTAEFQVKCFYGCA